MFKETIDFIKSNFNNKSFIALHEPLFIGKEREYVLDAIDSTFVSSVGKYVDRFEELIKEYTGAKYAIATVNGTSALHMSLLLAGVKQNDIVITQPLSFIATCNAISYINAEPYFIDVDIDTLGLSASKLAIFLEEKTITNNGKCFLKETGQKIAACVPMHTFGISCKIDTIEELCNKYGIPLIEDAAESLGTIYNNKYTGTFGLLGTYSFNGNKTITCGGGGVIVTNDEALGKLAKHLTTQSKVPHKWNFVHDNIGYNYRLPNLNAAMACAQMEQLENFIQAKRKLAHSYHDYFLNTNIKSVIEPVNCRSNYWLNAIILQDEIERDAFLEYANDNGVMSRPVWQLMNRLRMFENCKREDLSNAEFIEKRLVNIPSSVILN